MKDRDNLLIEAYHMGKNAYYVGIMSGKDNRAFMRFLQPYSGNLKLELESEYNLGWLNAKLEKNEG